MPAYDMFNMSNKNIIVYGLSCFECGKYAFFYDYKPENGEFVMSTHVVRTKRYPDYNPQPQDNIVCQHCGKGISPENKRVENLKKVKLKQSEVLS